MKQWFLSVNDRIINLYDYKVYFMEAYFDEYRVYCQDNSDPIMIGSFTRQDIAQKYIHEIYDKIKVSNEIKQT